MNADPTRAGEARGERRFLAFLVLGFLCIRLLWLYRVHGGFDGFLEASEATRVALSVAQHGVVGDAYHIGQGPTAHLMPLNPMISGAILWLFGPSGSAAHLMLLAWSLGQVVGGYLLVRLVFVRLGMDRMALRWGSVLLLLAAPFVPQETVDFRYWEGASALCLVALNMLAILRIERRGGLGVRDLVIVPLLFALTFFVSPPSGAAIGICWAFVALRRLPIRQSIALGSGTVAALALILTPWAMRNDRVLGDPVLLRSNFGLELALANHPAALSGEDPARIFHARLSDIHPAASAVARARVEAEGEVAYARVLARETGDWIAANPGGFVWLWLRHIGEMIAPRPWQMYFTGWEGARFARAWTISIVQLIGLAGLVLALCARRRRYWMIAGYIGVTVIAFAAFQPMPRYMFAIYPFLAFLAVDGGIRSYRLAKSRLTSRADARPPSGQPGLRAMPIKAVE